MNFVKRALAGLASSFKPGKMLRFIPNRKWRRNRPAGRTKMSARENELAREQARRRDADLIARVGNQRPLGRTPRHKRLKPARAAR